MPNEELVPNHEEEIIDDGPAGDDDGEQATVPPTPARRSRVDLSKAPQEALPFIEEARSQEKAKLYADQLALKQQLRAATKRLEALEKQTTPPAADDSRVTPKRKRGGEEDEDSISELRNLVTSLAEKIDTQNRRSDLRSYKTSKLNELRSQGIGLIESLVMGDDEESIDLSIEVAKAEYASIAGEIEAQLAARREQEEEDAGRRVAPSRKTVVVRNSGSRGRVAGVPPTVQPGAANAGPEMTVEELKELTSVEAIRDGRYKANKNRIMAALRSKSVYTGAGQA